MYITESLSIFSECLVHSLIASSFFSHDLTLLLLLVIVVVVIVVVPVRWYGKKPNIQAKTNTTTSKIAGDFFIPFSFSHFGCCAASFSCMLWEKYIKTNYKKYFAFYSLSFLPFKQISTYRQCRI
jgi:hypothetical protein